MRKARQRNRGRDTSELKGQTNLTLRSRLLRATPMIVFLIVMVGVLGRLGVLDKFETVALDTEAKLNKLPPESDVVIVNIDDDYDQQIFKRQSPLNPEKLHDLIDHIAACHPKVIGVDIDTSNSQFKEFNTTDLLPPIVWERDVKIPEGNRDKPEPLRVLGGKGAEFDLHSGLALLNVDPERKVARHYRRFIQTTEGPLPSFAWAIVHQFAPDKVKSLDQFAGPLFIKYAGDLEGSYRYELTAGKFTELYGKQQWQNEHRSNPFTNKIVLLGGSYLGQDQHSTPLGQMLGVRIHASIIETELAGGGLKQPATLALALLQVFEAFVLILLFHAFRPLKAFLISVIIIPPLALICSLVSYWSFSRWAFFAPVLVGLLIYELYEHYRRTTISRLYDNLSGRAHEPRRE